MIESQNGADAVAQSQQARENLQQLLTRSATDADFRKKLLTSPREAMAEHYGREIPGTTDIRFIENTADATFVLPDEISASELSESELETVAGGITLLSILLIAGSVVALAHEAKKIGDDDAWFS